MVTIEVLKDKRKRYCSVCNKLIEKGDILVKYDQVIDGWGATRKWFAHINCLIKALKDARKKLKNTRINIDRHRK